MNYMSPATEDSFIFTKSGKVRMHSIAIQRHCTKQLAKNVRDLLEGDFEVNVLDSLG
jgi:hypothetical protein